MKILPIAACLLIALTSCSRVAGLVSKASKVSPKEKAEKRSGFDGLPQGTVSVADRQPEKMESHEVEAGVDPALLPSSVTGGRALPKEDEIMFLNPNDDADVSEQKLADLLKGKEVEWMSSFTQARKLSVEESRPLLIWFTATPGERTNGSPASVLLERELFSNKKFVAWAKENVLRLKLDYTVKDRNSADGDKKSRALQQEKYLDSLKKRYNVNGFPTLIVVSPDGSVINNIRGYRSGQGEYTWGLLRTAVEHSNRRWETYQKKLAKEGYRHWSGKNGVKIYARLLSYQKGKLELVGPDGSRYSTEESNLSAADREWIESEKAKRDRS